MGEHPAPRAGAPHAPPSAARGRGRAQRVLVGARAPGPGAGVGRPRPRDQRADRPREGLPGRLAQPGGAALPRPHLRVDLPLPRRPDARPPRRRGTRVQRGRGDGGPSRRAPEAAFGLRGAQDRPALRAASAAHGPVPPRRRRHRRGLRRHHPEARRGRARLGPLTCPCTPWDGAALGRARPPGATSGDPLAAARRLRRVEPGRRPGRAHRAPDGGSLPQLRPTGAFAGARGEALPDGPGGAALAGDEPRADRRPPRSPSARGARDLLLPGALRDGGAAATSRGGRRSAGPGARRRRAGAPPGGGDDPSGAAQPPVGPGRQRPGAAPRAADPRRPGGGRPLRGRPGVRADLRQRAPRRQHPAAAPRGRGRPRHPRASRAHLAALAGRPAGDAAQRGRPLRGDGGGASGAPAPLADASRGDPSPRARSPRRRWSALGHAPPTLDPARLVGRRRSIPSAPSGQRGQPEARPQRRLARLRPARSQPPSP
jgi:hypothetical protein